MTAATSSHDPKLDHNNWSHWAVTHPALVLFLLIALMAGGVFAYMRLGRAEDPNFTVKVAIVTVVWPGATAQELQDQVVNRIEQRLQEIPYFDRVQTYTRQGFAAMQVIFRDDTPAREVPQLFYQIRKKIDDLRPQLPAGIFGPSVNDEYGDVDSVLYTLTGEGANYTQLRQVAQDMRRRLLVVSVSFSKSRRGAVMARW